MFSFLGLIRSFYPGAFEAGFQCWMARIPPWALDMELCPFPDRSHSTVGSRACGDSIPSSQLPRCQQCSTSIPHCQKGRSRYSQIDTKSKQSSGFYRPVVCVQLKKFSGWLLHSFKIASLGERAAFTYKYPFSCKESAFSGLSWKESSSLLIPTTTWEGFSKHTNVQQDGDTKCWYRRSREGQNPV